MLRKVMKRKFLWSLSALTLAVSAWAQPAGFYENDGTFVAPPQIPPNINALTFLNQGQFIINFTNGLVPVLPPPIGVPPYEMQNVRNYSNFFGKFMSGNTGFRFETYNSTNSQRQRAASFFNAGTINIG